MGALITLDEIAAWRGAAVEDLGDKVDLLAEVASDLVRDEAAQRFDFAVDTVVLTPESQSLLLPELPVLQVVEVSERAYSTDEWTVLTEGTDFELDLGADGRTGIIRRLGRWTSPYAWGGGTVRVTSAHGYAVPGNAPEFADDAETIAVPRLPGAIRGILLDAIDRALNIAPGVRQELIGRASTLYIGDGSALYLTQDDLRSLARFRPGSTA